MTAVQSQQAWNREYTQCGIPSSFRAAPSGALLWGLQQMNTSLDNKATLDVGCGAGRNAVYLAEQGCRVTAVDISEVAIARARQAAQEKNCAALIDFKTQPLQNGLPVPAASQDIIADIYSSFHVGNSTERRALIAQIANSLKPDGFYIYAGCGHDDGYYTHQPTIETLSSRGKIIRDEALQVPVALHDVQSLLVETEPFFDLIAYQQEYKSGPMYSRDYIRSNINAVFRLKKSSTNQTE